jgi:hypothetical protein
MPSPFSQRANDLGTAFAPIGLHCNDARTHSIKPGISLSFDFKWLQDTPAVAFLAWRVGAGLQWSHSRTYLASSRICSMVSSPSRITRQLLNSMCGKRKPPVSNQTDPQDRRD